MESSLPQGGEEPAGRVTTVEHQEVIGAEFVEVFEECRRRCESGRKVTMRNGSDTGVEKWGGMVCGNAKER
jgi:hypothetical protein